MLKIRKNTSGEINMPKAVMFGKYSPEAWKGAVEQGSTARETQVRALFESLGASLDAFYMLPGGDWDFMLMIDVPGADTLAAVKKAVSPTGAVIAQDTKVIMTAAEFDASGSGSYNAPNS
jgi:uncharacterized protein with GYD domain